MRPEPRRQFGTGSAKKKALPRRDDFITRAPNWSGHSEQEDAWKHFGRKTLDEAYRVFCEAPDDLHEDFMFMGAMAFRFYVPVLDRYIRSLDPATLFNTFFPSMEYLAACIGSRFERHEDMAGTHQLILALCDYVNAHLNSTPPLSKRNERTRQRWADLRDQVAKDLP